LGKGTKQKGISKGESEKKINNDRNEQMRKLENGVDAYNANN